MGRGLLNAVHLNLYALVRVETPVRVRESLLASDYFPLVALPSPTRNSARARQGQLRFQIL